MAEVVDGIMVSISYDTETQKGVLVVGRKRGRTKPIDVVRAVSGEEAYELYKKIIGGEPSGK